MTDTRAYEKSKLAVAPRRDDNRERRIIVLVKIPGAEILMNLFRCSTD